METNAQELVEEAVFEFTMGDHSAAIEKLDQALTLDPDCFEGWHAKAEVYFDLRNLDAALEAGRKAEALSPDDVHIHTTLSRIWMERGDKTQAEHHGARARMLGWKEQLKEPSSDGSEFA